MSNAFQTKRHVHDDWKIMIFEVIKCYIFNSWKHLQEAACIIGKEKLRLVKWNLLQN